MDTSENAIDVAIPTALATLEKKGKIKITESGIEALHNNQWTLTRWEYIEQALRGRDKLK